MGGCYTNITLNIGDRGRVVAALRQAGRDAFVSPVDNGGVVVFDQVNDRTCGLELDELSSRLSQELQCAALGVAHADGSCLSYELYLRGERVDHYEVSPDRISGGHAEQLCGALAPQAPREGIEAILRQRFAVQTDRHQALVSALGLPAAAVGLGYEYLTREADDLRSTYGEFVRVVPERPVPGEHEDAETIRALPWQPGDPIPTLAGVAIGRTRAEVAAILGTPTRSVALGALTLLRFAEQGIEVLLQDDPPNVRGVRVSKRNGPELNGVHVGDSWASVMDRWGPPSERWTISVGEYVTYLYHVGRYWTLNVDLDDREQRVLTLALGPSLIGAQERHRAGSH